jgi:formylglycine-generating enzyme required for sulfatase activity
MVDVMRSNMLLSSVLRWLQRQSSLWPLALGSVLGLGIGAGALWGIGGLIGIAVCLVVLGTACWCARDAEPVLVGVDIASTPQEASSAPALEPAPEPEPPLVEPLEMVELPGGTFWMGSPDTNAEAYEDEKPRHEVTVSVFAISRYLITLELYRELCSPSPASWQRDSDDKRLPANNVSWFDAVSFCNALSQQMGLQPCYRIDGTQVAWDKNADGYRLPTEAEWEYACRAGTTSRWFFGDDPTALDRYAWFATNANNTVQPVGEKTPNPWGLYDMSGNVWEWCWDWYGTYRAEVFIDPIGPENGDRCVLRGGAARVAAPRNLRSASRVGGAPLFRDADHGFRCVRRPRRQP